MRTTTNKSLEDILSIYGFGVADHGTNPIIFSTTNSEIRNFISEFPNLTTRELASLDYHFWQYKSLCCNGSIPFSTNMIQKTQQQIEFASCDVNPEQPLRKITIRPIKLGLGNISNMVMAIRNGGALSIAELSTLGSCLIHSDTKLYYDKNPGHGLPMGTLAEVCERNTSIFSPDASVNIQKELEERAEDQGEKAYYADKFMSSLRAGDKPYSSSTVLATRIHFPMPIPFCTEVTLMDHTKNVSSGPVEYTREEANGSLIDFASKVGDMSTRRMVKEIGRK